MSWIDAVRFRLRTIFDRERLGREMEDEVRFHLEQDVHYEGLGPTLEAARSAARRRLGHLPTMERARRRETGLGRLDRLSQDLRYASRQLVRAPGFTFAVTMTLALGIGANATMFSIIDRIMLRAPDGIAAPDAVLQVRSWRSTRAGRDSSSAMSYPSYMEFRALNDVFQRVTAVRGPMEVTVDRGLTASRASGALVANDYFETLGARTELGRFFSHDETSERAGAPVAVLSHGYWKRRYAGAPDVLGKDLVANGMTYTIVGVAAGGFSGHTLDAVDFWLPIASAPGLRMGREDTWASERGSRWLTVIARLRDGISPEQALARVSISWTAWNIRPERTSVAAPHAYFVSMVPGDGVDRPEHRVARLLGGVAILLLLISCANVANLLLARALSRRREIAVRLALGVNRRRLTTLLLTDALLVALLGGVAALAVASVGIPVIRAVLFAGTQTTSWSVDARLVWVTMAVALGAGVLAGAIPAWQASRPSLIGALRQGSRDGAVHRSRTRAALLITQGALSVALLSGTGLFVRSLQRLGDLSLGLDLDRVLIADFPSRDWAFPEADARRTYDAMRVAASTIAGVERSSLTVGVPLEGQYALPLRLPGHDSIPNMPRGRAPFIYAVTPGFLETLGTRLLAGRGLVETDVGGPPVAVVNQRMATLLWSGDALGRCFKIELNGPTPDCIQVVGIVEDARRSALLEPEASPQYYVPLGQQPALMSELSLVIRATDPTRVQAALQRTMQAVRPDLPYVSVRTLEDAVARELRPWRLGASVFGWFGGLALVVATMGTYSVMQFGVAQRRQELGIRIALGATRRDVLRLVTGDSLRVGVLAAAAGVAVVLATGRWLDGLLFETSVRDPVVLGGVVTGLLAATLAATLVPAWRASRVDPVATLRSD